MLLAEHRVPVAVLNACQSAMQDGQRGQPGPAAGPRPGSRSRSGMAYSVTVSAAELAMPVLYGQIADGAELTAAVHAARRQLYDDTRPGRRISASSWTWRTGCCRSCSPSSPSAAAAADGRRRAGRVLRPGRRRRRTSQPPSTGLSAGTWTSRPSSGACWPARTPTSC